MNRKISLPRRIMVKSAGAFSDLLPENHMLQTTEYTISSEKIPREFEGYRILQLSDLHSRCFGHENARLLRKIEEAEPDLIVMTGDMITRTDLDHHVFLHAARLLGKRYLCYYVLGNHEQALKPADFSVYLACVSSFGVRVLDNAKADLFRNGESIRLYGMWYPLKYYKESKHIAKHEVFQAGDMHRLMGRCDASRYTILLTHNPLSFPVYSGWGGGSDIVRARSRWNDPASVPRRAAVARTRLFSQIQRRRLRKKRNGNDRQQGAGQRPVRCSYSESS